MFVVATVSFNYFLDKLGVEKLSVLMRELGKCSCWESAHRNIGPGIEEIFGFFLFWALFQGVAIPKQNQGGRKWQDFKVR
jgi:hypothetical protein